MTRSKVELAVFTKLICAYSLNTVAVPIFVSVLPPTFDRASHAFVGRTPGITQAWYESGGRRAGRHPYAHLKSRHRPPEVHPFPASSSASSRTLCRVADRLNALGAATHATGGVYAETFRSICVGMVYAPIYPPAFLITSFALFSNLYSTRFAIATWMGDRRSSTPAHEAHAQLLRMACSSCLAVAMVPVHNRGKGARRSG